MNSLANNCLLKVATFAAQLEQYQEAIEKFENVATASMSSALSKFSVKEYLFKAGLCHFCLNDPVSAARALERYQEIDPTFQGSREQKLLSSILEAIETNDVQMFTDYVADYDRMTKLDNWKTAILLRIKKCIDAEPSLT